MQRVSYQIHRMCSNPDPVKTREVYHVQKTFNAALQKMAEVGVFSYLIKGESMYNDFKNTLFLLKIYFLSIIHFFSKSFLKR